MSLDQLTNLIAAETTIPASADVQKLSNAIQAQGGVAGILFYGSGLWKAAEEDTIYDFYVLVDRFRDFDQNKIAAILGTLLAPNVYYMELKDGARTLRCKYALMRLDQFEKAAAGRAITPQIWARFAQPCRLVYSRDTEKHTAIHNALTACVISFHRRSLPLALPDATPRDIWLRGLQETYGAELRSEKPERTRILFEASQDSFTKRSELAIASLPNIPRNSKTVQIISRIKRPLQKLVVFLRLMKATMTFEGGVDYALWKVERQSGVRIEANNFQRHYPLIAAWPLVWKLWRKGAFR